MASIFKRKRLLPIPEGATITTGAKGKRHATWTNGRGTKRAEVVRTKGGDDRVAIEDAKYSIAYFTASGVRRLVAGTADKKATEQIAKKLETDEAQFKYGVRDEQREQNAKEAGKPIKQHIEAFRNKMKTANRAAEHINGTVSIIERFVESQRISTIAQISTDRVTKYAAGLNDDDASTRTVHAHMTALKSFTRWLTRTGKLSADPLAFIEKPTILQQKHRRFCKPDEFALLLKAARSGPDRYGMSGDERAILFDLAVQTGLRLGEIKSMTCSQLHLEAKPPYVEVAARSTKNREPAKQYILPHLVAKLREHTAKKIPAAPVFTLPKDRKRVPQSLREDLEAARAAWLKQAVKRPGEYKKQQQSDFLLATNHKGDVLDFHALRHTCGAWACEADAPPKAVQRLMRHSTITLTLDVYGHYWDDDAKKTIQRLAKMHPEAKRAG